MPRYWALLQNEQEKAMIKTEKLRRVKNSGEEEHAKFGVTVEWLSTDVKWAVRKYEDGIMW